MSTAVACMRDLAQGYPEHSFEHSFVLSTLGLSSEHSTGKAKSAVSASAARRHPPLKAYTSSTGGVSPLSTLVAERNFALRVGSIRFRPAPSLVRGDRLLPATPQLVPKKVGKAAKIRRDDGGLRAV